MEQELGRIDALRVVAPDGAFYFFVDVRPYGSSAEVARSALLEHGVITIPGEAFGAGGTGWLRLSFACDDDDLIEGISRLRRALAARS